MQQLTISYREHRELGNVVWLRSYDQARTEAAKLNRPIFLLFQEIPGCQTCVRYGHDVLSHPLMVDMIESQFVPLAIFNNHPGADAEVLRAFGEAPWNNPVAYILRSDGTPMIGRLANRYDPLAIHAYIFETLRSANRTIPAFFDLLRGDLLCEAGLTETATYETPCFWSGETSLAQAPGVIETTAGWIGSEEVVRVQFDPATITRNALDQFAAQEGFCVNTDSGFRIDDEPEFYLRKHKARHLPLSAAQRTKLNFLIPYGQSPNSLLSPQQGIWLLNDDLTRLSDGETYRRAVRESWPVLAQLIPGSHPEKLEANP